MLCCVTDFLSLNIFFSTKRRLAPLPYFSCSTLYISVIHSYFQQIPFLIYFFLWCSLTCWSSGRLLWCFLFHLILVAFVYILLCLLERPVLAEGLLLTLGCVFFSSTAIVHQIHTKIFSNTRYFFTLWICYSYLLHCWTNKTSAVRTIQGSQQLAH